MENRSDAVLSGKLSNTVVGIFFVLIFFLFDSNRAMGQNTEDDIPDPSLIQYGFISDTVPVNLENSTVLVTLRNGYKLLDRTSANRVLKSMYNESDIPVHVAGIILPSADADNADFSKAF